MKKVILFLLNKEVAFLPPFMSILNSLSDNYCLKVISYESLEGRKRLINNYANKDISFLWSSNKKETKGILSRIHSRLIRLFNVKSQFHKDAIEILNSTQYDLLWIIHEETAFEFRKELVSKKYILSLYELNDHRMKFLSKIRMVLQNAQELIVPEYNRACILRVWEHLKNTPTVLPNKPSEHPRQKNIPNSYSKRLEGKKIILYQGYINRSRNIDKICEAIYNMNDYCIVLMGKGDESYISELTQKYPQIIHISFIAPPEHLYITSYAYIAIVKYDFVLLNAIFCAPNKTWEYTGFGIPVLCHDIPGLTYTIGKYNAGICTNLDDVKCVKKAILEIDSNYAQYSLNAQKFYDSVNIELMIKEIVGRNINFNNG